MKIIERCERLFSWTVAFQLLRSCMRLRLNSFHLRRYQISGDFFFLNEVIVAMLCSGDFTRFDAFPKKVLIVLFLCPS